MSSLVRIATSQVRIPPKIKSDKMRLNVKFHKENDAIKVNNIISVINFINPNNVNNPKASFSL